MDDQQNGAEGVFVYAVSEVESSVLHHRHDTDLSLYLCKTAFQKILSEDLGLM